MWQSDVFADDNTTQFGDHWAVDWMEIGHEIPNSRPNGSYYIIGGMPTLLDNTGTGLNFDGYYLLGRKFNGFFSRRKISLRFKNTLINTKVINFGNPALKATFTPEDFGRITLQTSALSPEIEYAGGIAYEFYRLFVLTSANSGGRIDGPLGPNATFSTNPLFRISESENASDIDLLKAFADKIMSQP